jgi:FtsP/CotA-like multicopper oxidase with cupredoxin domain/peroxiredoxin
MIPDDKAKRTTRRASRRHFLAIGGAGSLGAAITIPMLVGARSADVRRSDSAGGHGAAHSMGGLGTVGDVAPNEYFDATRFLTTWNDAPMPRQLAPRDGWSQDQFYRETKRDDGTRLREYQFIAVDREIEIAPGVYFPAWTYNNQVPGPTIRATEGDRIRIRFVNEGSHPHTIHFHGWHPYQMDGAFPEQFVNPHEEFIYEFDADPVGLHLYHCHSVPLKRHIHKGLYGVFIVDPDPRKPEYEGKLQAVARSRNPDYDENGAVREVIMMMNGFDTDFDADNEVYAVNTIAFQYMRHPIPVKVGDLVRVYLVNITEFDPINSFHLHAGFFDVFRTGTKLETAEHTDTVTMCQAERAILEFKLRWPGLYMFHAHQSEFAELGWMGAFEATEGGTVARERSPGKSPIAAPAFELTDSDGRPVSLADYVGRSNLVLVLSQGGGCTHCMDQARGLAGAAAEFRAKGAELLLVTPSSRGLESIAIRHAADAAGSVFRKYGLYKTANQPGHGTFLVDKSGLVRWQQTGNEPFMDHARLLAELDRVNAAS